MTYLTLNAVFLLAVAAVVIVAALRSRRHPRRRIRWPAVAIAAGALLVATAVFDNVMIAIGLVGYDEARITGIRIGVAPLEDFAYAIAAVLLLPALWHLTSRRGDP